MQYKFDLPAPKNPESWRSICAYNLAWLSFSLMVPFNFQLLSQPHLIKCSLRYAEDNTSFTPLGSMQGKIWMDIPGNQWYKKKKSPQSAPSNKNHRVFSALLYIKYRVKMHCSGKRRNESIYWATSTWRVFFSFYLFLHAGFISTLKSIYQTFRSGRLAINSLRGGMWKNKNLSKI